MKPLLDKESSDSSSSELSSSSSEAGVAVKKDPVAFCPKYSFNREKKTLCLDLGDGSFLMLWIEAVQMDVVNGVKTLRGDAMLDLGERGKKDWCGFKDLTIKLAPYGPQSIAPGQAFLIPKWWYQIVTDNRKLSKFLTGHPFPVQYPLRHRRFLENEAWPVPEEQWSTIRDLRLVLA